MSKGFDPEYYRARLRAELAAVATATTDKAREVHQALADHYAELLAGNGHSNGEDGPDLMPPPPNLTGEEGSDGLPS